VVVVGVVVLVKLVVVGVVLTEKGETKIPETEESGMQCQPVDQNT
jgi:hypothetical protein